MTLQKLQKQYTLCKGERLSSKKRTDLLFTKGKSFVSFPLRVVYYQRETEVDIPPISILISVAKKKVKVVPKRNRIKRLIREAYRLNKYEFIRIFDSTEKGVDIAFLYLKSDEPTNYSEIEVAILKASKILEDRIIHLK